MIQVAFINGNEVATANPIYQWDYGQQLYIYGLNQMMQLYKFILLIGHVKELLQSKQLIM